MLKTHESGKEGERESGQKWAPPALVPSFRRATGWIVVNQLEWEGGRLPESATPITTSPDGAKRRAGSPEDAPDEKPRRL